MRARAQRLLIVTVALAALAASLFAFRDELRTRKAVERAVSESGLDVRRPSGVRTLRYQRAADFRASYFADMTLDDVYQPVSLAKLSAEERGRWLRSLTTLDAQLMNARVLVLDALARRPGWAYHHSMLGEVEYVILRRDSLRAAADGSRRWETPIRNGMSAAPGNLTLPMRLAGAYIETWGVVEPTGDAAGVMRRAMKSEVFVSRNYRLVGLIFGEDRAIDMLPDDPRVLRIAFSREKQDARVDAAALLRDRIDSTIRIGRSVDLGSIRERARLRDTWAQRSQARQWVAKYRLEELDDAAGRGEIAELLALWPEARRGSWLRDPRADVVRFFLSGRETDVNGAALLDAVETLADVPEPVRARALALAGQTREADQMIRSSNTVGSFEWTPVIVDLARRYLEEGEHDAASTVLGRLAPSARDECNVLLLRRELGDESAAAQLDRLVDGAVPGGEAALSLCVDPQRHSEATLLVSLTSPDRSLVSFGWDGGRLGSVVVDQQRDLALPLSGIRGRHPFRVETEAGPDASIARAVIVPAEPGADRR